MHAVPNITFLCLLSLLLGWWAAEVSYILWSMSQVPCPTLDRGAFTIQRGSK